LSITFRTHWGDVERRILGLFALQTPVASDLWLLTALLHINLHLERVGDQAVNLAKITELTSGLPPNPKVLQRLEEMGALALGMVGRRWARLRAAISNSPTASPRWTILLTG
jgi:hypothetical protein